MEYYDAVIIGAGQAGIAMGYYLKKEGISFIVCDENERIGDSWRKRYDSLVLFTPRRYSCLPELRMNGSADGFPTKDEMANYLASYVNHFNIPVKCNTLVYNIIKKHDLFYVETNKGRIEAKNVIIASGAFQKPYIPPVFKEHEQHPLQFHSSSYVSPRQIPKTSVLIVGGGNSGAQIALELAKEREVTMAVSHRLKFLPLRFLGRSIFDWLERLGLLYAGVDTKRGKWFKKQKDPIFGKELKGYIKNKQVQLKPKVVSVIGKEVVFEDHSRQTFDTVIWATGFVPSYEWISIEGVKDSDGKPIHKRGISEIDGLYFLGLPWQYQRGSALICGVSHDANYLLSHILTNLQK
ncbi:flavin-containing monooxygenase [Halalkalibacter urbisdiaboli]|uniref:flavin-containing monooxygenase n=1 Tax=Halalkalibacter urbisdiaboli TaxID=1960589 RepID=UPI000B452C17|nr:NAD(P)/FAD-dependent oxidoreductase [Halalkalibacter urbisdiaboli]